MNKKNILLLIFILSNSYIFSQQVRLPPPTVMPTAGAPPAPKDQYQRFPSQFIDPATGKLLESIYPNIQGSPFFIEDWKYSLIKLSDGRMFDMVKAKINLFSDEIYFKGNNNVEMVLDSGYIKEINVYDAAETKNIIYKFRTGFPGIDNQNKNTFYQVLSSGKIELLKLIRKKVSTIKNDNFGETEKQFIVYEDYYFFKNNQMKRLKKDRTFILKALDDKKEKIDDYTKQHTIDYKNIDDIANLFTFYNSLFSL